MDSITSVEALHSAILRLEDRREEQGQQIKDHLKEIVEWFKPFNIVKAVVRGVVGSPGTQHNLLSAAMSLASGYLSRKLLVRPPAGPVKKIVGGLLQWGVTSLLGISLFLGSRHQ